MSGSSVPDLVSGVRDSGRRTERSDKQRTRADWSLRTMSERAAWSRKPPEETSTFPATPPLRTCSADLFPNSRGDLIRYQSVKKRELAAEPSGESGSPVRLRSLAAPRGRLRLTFAEISGPEPTCVSAIACVNKIKDGLNES